MNYELKKAQKVSLGIYPTPLEKLSNFNASHPRISMYIKRDDATGPAFGGNKTRKLEYVIHEALQQGCTAILTVGGPQTNHGRTTVAAAVMAGLKPILVLSGTAPDYLSGNLTLDAMMGADIIFSNGSKTAVEDTVKHYEELGYKVYNLPGGGSNFTGIVGYIEAVPEIIKQCRDMGIAPKYIVCAAGSMGTYGGLCIGAKYYNAPFKIIGIPVSPPFPGFTDYALDFMNGTAEYYDMDFRFKAKELNIINGPDDAPFGGEEYNKPDSVTRRYMFELARTEGIILDPTYTGKAFRGFVELADSGVLNGGAIFLHTGGAVAVWTKEHLDDMQNELFKNCHIVTL